MLVPVGYRFEQIHPLENLTVFSELVGQLLIDSILTEEDRGAILENEVGHLVHVADQLEDEVFVLS